MLMHGEPAKRIAEYCGTSIAMIESSYGEWIGGSQGFGEAALKAAQPKPTPKPSQTDQIKFEQIQPDWNGGEGGIRTPGTLIRGTHDFQSCTFNRSVTSPFTRPRIDRVPLGRISFVSRLSTKWLASICWHRQIHQLSMKLPQCYQVF